VINTAMVQSHHQQRQTREVMESHGYYYASAGIGNFYQFRLMLDVARAMERTCPDAWLIQSGNPVFDVCTSPGRSAWNPDGLRSRLRE
jgi:alpha-galactosidase